MAAVAPVLTPGYAQVQPAPTLYAGTVRRALAGAVRLHHTEYLVEDLRTGEVLAGTFAHPGEPMPPGSLLKPFLVLAHRGPWPRVSCLGHGTGCWRQGGHGKVTLVPALGWSCNTYFLELASEPLDTDVFPLLGLPEPPSRDPRVLVGLSPAWQVTPRALLEAYVRLLEDASPALLDGLRAAAGPQGTATALRNLPGGALAKTGTAPCVSQPGEPCVTSGDGLAVAFAPALRPVWLVLVRRRGTTGAVAAETAHQILHTLELLRAR